MTAAALVASVAVVALPAPPAAAALVDLPPGFVDETVVGGLPYPTAIAFDRDARMFVALKSGVVRLAEDGALLDTPFVDVSARVHDNHDRGLLGLAVHPQFPEQPYVYLLYTHDPAGTAPDRGDPVVGRTAQLLRVAADPATGYRTALAGSETVLVGAAGTRENIGNENDGRDTSRASCMTGGTMAGDPVEDCIPSDENSHTIGSLVFAPDGSLFVSNGDGSNYGGVDPRALRSQDPDSLAGKVLRIDPLTGEGVPDNPSFDPAAPSSNRSKTYASGLRNPFRMTVHPTTGEAYIGDVGWNNWEEINTGKGANFGWPCYEGGVPGASQGSATASLQQGAYRSNGATGPACQALYDQGAAAVRAPAYAYDHSAGGASANGGAVYTGTTWPEQYRGALFIADYNQRWIRALTFDAAGRATMQPFARESTGAGPVQVIAGPDTNLYWMRYTGSGGEVRRIRYVGAGNTPPVARAAASPTIGQAPMAVTFSSTGSYDPDAEGFSYRWDFGDGATSTEPDPSHTYTTPGVYDATLTLTETSDPSATGTATVRITVGNNPPLATVTAPPGAAGYAIGDQLVFTGTGTSGGAPLPASALSWEVRHRHNEHYHYSRPESAVSPTDPTVSTMTLVPDDHGDKTSYEVCLTATAGPDLTDTRCAPATPRTTPHTLATEPVGLELQYEDEGLSLQGPAIIEPIVGSTQTVSVDAVQQSRSFVRWSDGLTTRSRTWTVGAEGRTFTAVYENLAPTARATATPATGAAPLTVQLDGSASSDPEGDALQYAWTDGQGGTHTGPTPTVTYPTPGTYPVSLTVTDQLGASATTTVDVVVTGLPAPWTTTSVGAVTDPGAATWAGGTFTVTNAGPGITGRADAMRFVHQPRTGDVTLVTRVDSFPYASWGAKAGIVVRESLDPGSRQVMVALAPNWVDGVRLLARAEPGGTTATAGTARFLLAPRWLKLERRGDVFTAFQSADGTTWTRVGSTTVAMGATVEVGLAVGSQSPTATATARFSGVQVS